MTTLELLMALQNGGGPGLPAPAQPRDLGPLMPQPAPTQAPFELTNPAPSMPPAAPARPIDTAFVDRYSGSAPVRPELQPPSTLDKIGAVLMGIGYGPAAVEQIRRQRNEPFERYERQLERYEDRRTRGVELSLRQNEQDADRVNRAAELAYQRDYNLYLKKLGIRQDEADERTRQAFEMYKFDRQAKAQEAKEREAELRRKKERADQIEERYFTATRNRALSRELGEHWSGLSDRPLSAAAARLDEQLAGIGEVRMQRATGAGTGTGGGLSAGAARALQAFEAARQQVITARQNGDVRGEREARRRWAATYGALSRYPREIERGGGDTEWPYAKARNAASPAPAAPAQAPQQQPQPQADPLGILR